MPVPPGHRTGFFKTGLMQPFRNRGSGDFLTRRLTKWFVIRASAVLRPEPRIVDSEDRPRNGSCGGRV